MRLSLILSAIATLAVPVFSSNAAESDDQENNSVDEIVVKGRYLSIDKLNSVKTPTPVIDVPQSLSILTSEQIQEQAFQNFGDVLRYTPGLSISQGEGHRDAIVIRGIQSTADFFIDGIRDDVQYFRPLYNAEQVEILRGGNALLFGRGGGGGIINRVQKRAMTDQNFSSVNFGLDTFGSAVTSFDSNTGLSDSVGFRVNAYYQQLANHRDFFDGESFAINPTMTFELGDTTTATVSYEYVDDDRVVDRGVPSQNTAFGPNVPLRGFDDTFFGSGDQNLTTFNAHILRARIEHEFSDALRGNVTAHYADYDKLYQNLYASAPVDVVNGSFAEVELDGYRDTTTRENLILQANLIADFETGGLQHTILLGSEIGDQQTTNARLDNRFETNDQDQDDIPFTDPLQIPGFEFSALSRDRDSDVQFTSLYIQDQIDLTDQFKVVLGLRLDQFDIDVFDRIEAGDGDPIDGSFTRSDDEITPRLGFIYKPRDNVSVYASYSETFLPRSGDQFLTLNLDSESTRPQFFENREVGIKWDLRPDLSLTAAVFNLERESFTSIDPEDPEQLIVVEGSETTGFEIQLVGNLTERWSLTSGYSYLDGEVQLADGSGNNGNVTRQTPENMFSLWSNYRLSDRLAVAVGTTYQDSFFVREDNSVEVPSFTRVDAALFYDVSDTFRVQLNIENLFDEDYFPDAHSNDNISTGEPVNARLSMVLNF